MIGPFAGALPALLLAAPFAGPPLLWTAVAFLVIQQIDSNILVPRLVGRAVGLHPVAGILALLAGFEVGGIIGALFAVLALSVAATASADDDHGHGAQVRALQRHVARQRDVR